MDIFSILIFLCGIFFSASEHVLIVALFEDDMENKLKLTKSFLRRCMNLSQLVCGKSTSTSETSFKEVQDSSEGEESDDDEFFKPKVEGMKVEGNKVFLDIICMVISLIVFFLI